MMAPKSAARIVGTLLEDDADDDVLDDGDEEGLRGKGPVSALGRRELSGRGGTYTLKPEGPVGLVLCPV